MRITNAMNEQAEKHLERLWQCATPDELALFEVHKAAIKTVFAYSDFIARSCIACRAMLADILQSGTLNNDDITKLKEKWEMMKKLI